ncbi:MAG: YceI family protein [Ilumatobacteraceae bacterium]|nr:YceI family protein [Ilumatobacteraceae bacterium]
MSDTTTIPGYVAGTWTIDAVHSEVGFSVRHMMVSKVRGKFTKFEGELVTGATPLESSVTATIELSSIDTGNTDRDNHVRSADFFNVESHTQMTYKSTGVRASGSDYILDGELTLKGVTKSVPLTLELGGFGPDAYGGTRAGFTATGEISRSDFGVDFNAALETGGVVLGDKVAISMEIEAVLKA